MMVIPLNGKLSVGDWSCAFTCGHGIDHEVDADLVVARRPPRMPWKSTDNMEVSIGVDPRPPACTARDINAIYPTCATAKLYQPTCKVMEEDDVDTGNTPRRPTCHIMDVHVVETAIEPHQTTCKDVPPPQVAVLTSGERLPCNWCGSYTACSCELALGEWIVASQHSGLQGRGHVEGACPEDANISTLARACAVSTFSAAQSSDVPKSGFPLSASPEVVPSRERLHAEVGVSHSDGDKDTSNEAAKAVAVDVEPVAQAPRQKPDWWSDANLASIRSLQAYSPISQLLDVRLVHHTPAHEYKEGGAPWHPGGSKALYEQMGMRDTQKTYIASWLNMGNSSLVSVAEVFDQKLMDSCVHEANFLSQRLKLVPGLMQAKFPLPSPGPDLAEAVGAFFGMQNVGCFPQDVAAGFGPSHVCVQVDLFSKWFVRMGMQAGCFRLGNIVELLLVDSVGHAVIASFRISVTQEFLRILNVGLARSS